MPDYTTSTNMGLTIPIVSQTDGPTYATYINNDLSNIIDSHDHSSGKGVRITPDGINISSDLPFGDNNVTQARSVRFNPQSSTLAAASDLGCLYESGVDLYYNDGSGNQIRLTQSGGVSGTPGSITSLVAPATVTYTAPSFVFQSGVNTAGNLDGRNVILRNSSASSNGLTLSPPSGMPSDFTITLPTLPASQSFMTIDGSGAMAAPVVYPLPTAGIANAAVTVAKLQASNYLISSSSGVASVTVSSMSHIANLGMNFTSNGRPIIITLIPDGTQGASSTNDSYFSVAGTTTSSPLGRVGLTRDDVIVSVAGIGGVNVDDGSSGATLEYPVSSFSFFDTPAAGTYGYSIQLGLISGTSVTIRNAKLVIYELF